MAVDPETHSDSNKKFASNTGVIWSNLQGKSKWPLGGLLFVVGFYKFVQYSKGWFQLTDSWSLCCGKTSKAGCFSRLLKPGCEKRNLKKSCSRIHNSDGVKWIRKEFSSFECRMNMSHILAGSFTRPLHNELWVVLGSAFVGPILSIIWMRQSAYQSLCRRDEFVWYCWNYRLGAIVIR